MTPRGILRRICLGLVNHPLAGTRFFGAKRRLLTAAGFDVGAGAKVVGPVFCTGRLAIGEGTWIGRNLTVHGNGVVVIGSSCDIAPDVMFLTGGHGIGSPSRRAGEGESYVIHVGDGSWVGARATVMGDVELAPGCVVAACACVVKDVPANTLVGGVPARQIRDLGQGGGCELMHAGKVARNAGWLISGNVLHKLLSFLMGIAVARYLGPASSGLIDYASAYTGFFASLCTLGINSVLVKELMDHPESQGEALGTTFGLRAVSSVLSALAIICLSHFVDRGDPLATVVVALSTVGLVFQIYDGFNYWFQSRLQSRYCAIAANVSYLVACVMQVTLILIGADVRPFALATAVDGLVAGLILFRLYKKLGGARLSFSLERGKHLLSLGIPFVLASLMQAVYASTDKFMLGQMMDSSVVSFYARASSLSLAWTFILSAVIDSMYPPIIEARVNDRKAYEKLNRQLYALVFYISTGISVLVFAFADPIVRILYGDAYLPAVGPLRVAVWYTALSYLGVARNAWVVCEGQQRYLKYLYGAAAVLNVIGNLLLIPAWGPTGAAVASLATELAVTFALPAFIKPLRPNAKLMLDALFLRDVLPDRDKEGHLGR